MENKVNEASRNSLDEMNIDNNQKPCLFRDQNVLDLLELQQSRGINFNTVNNEVFTESSTPQSDSQTTSACTTNSAKECILCFNFISEADYEAHVQACLPKTPDVSRTNTIFQRKQDACLNCSCLVNSADDSGFIIPCRLNHIYCFQCLYTAMKEFLASKLMPVCHAAFCDYQLSRYDLACIPLTQRMFHQILPLVQTQQRPQCPRCCFYVEIQQIVDLDQHIESCHPENMVPCEYCYCPTDFSEYEEHRQQCASDGTGRQQKLVEYILPRTKYPFRAQQIDFFIENKKKDHHSIIHPLSIVEELAEYNDVFPMELPTRDCDICMESCFLDDIFVFGCDESHKLCYKCYEQSCIVKMNNNEILTCATCPYQLQYGELKQLRISPDQRNLVVEYQVQKTFDRYASGSRGVIKCPNQACMWAFEPGNPNEHFRVTCQMCANEFCSFCNQQYHYRTVCEKIPVITERWFFWCNTERGRYLAERAKQDANYAVQLAEYEKQHAASRQRNEELRRRYETSVEDEKYKAQNCRYCPHCNRVVERMEGCDSMVCGRDYHGGNVQSGCGKNFTWEQAKRYKSAAIRRPEQLANELPAPESPLVVHENINCDGCHEAVRGIRFDCVHCPSLIYCEKCEQRCTLAHSDENRRQGQRQHVFRLIMTPFEDAAYF
ncbi:unnamed protein product [Rotaria magnacalcarata]